MNSKDDCGIRAKIPAYLEKIEKQHENYNKQFETLNGKFMEQVKCQLDKYFSRAKVDFSKQCKSLDKQLATLQYYSEHPEDSHNLYPLFNQIDQKLIYNSHLIEDCHLKISLPEPTSCELDDEVLLNKITLLENYVRQLSNVVRSEAVRKYCKKEAELGDKIIKNYGTMLQKVKESVYTPEVKIKNMFEDALVELRQYKHVQKLTLSLTAPQGILMPANYHHLIESLHPNRIFLTSLTIKLMDMQFSQQKCDIIRKRLPTQFKQLKQLIIQNYYKQCKLGMFEDFNWHPYRKKVNIVSGVW